MQHPPLLQSLPPSPPARLTATLLSVASLTVMANAIISPALPGLRTTFRDTPEVTTLVGLVMTMPSLFIVLTAAGMGLLADRIGRRPLVLAALGLYGLAGASALFAETLPQLLVGRAFLGCAVGATMTASVALIGDHYAGAARERMVSLQAVVMSGSAVPYMLAGGLLAEAGWRYPFLLYLASFIIAVPVALYVHDVPRHATMAAASARASLPVATLVLVCSVACYTMLAYYTVPTLLPFLLVKLGVTSPVVIAMTVASSALCMSVNAFFFRRLRAVLAPLWIYAFIFVALALGFAVVASATSIVGVASGVCLLGSGLGYLFPNSNSLLLARTPDAVRGRAAGIMTTAVFLGGFLSPLIGGPIADRSGYAVLFYGYAVVSALIAAGFALAARLRPL
jgi:MFS family permease